MNNYTKNHIEEQRNYTVVKSNTLVLNSRYQYSLAQQRSIAYICSKIKPEDGGNGYQLEYRLDISEYLQLLGVESNGYQYKLIKETLGALSDKSMWLPVEDEDGAGEVLVRWLSNVVVYPKSGKIKIKLDEYLMPYLFGLKEKYLSYGLSNILNFKSKYGIRLYEILKAQYDMMRSQQGKKRYETPVLEWVISLEELKHRLMAEDYVNYKDFRIKVLETAQRDINVLSDMHFEFEPICKGRKTVQVCFLIRFKELLERL